MMTTRRVFLTALTVGTLMPIAAVAQSARIVFRNNASVQIEVFWMNPSTGSETSYAVVTPGASYTVDTAIGHVWRFRRRGGPPIASDWTVSRPGGTLEIRDGGWDFRPN